MNQETAEKWLTVVILGNPKRKLPARKIADLMGGSIRSVQVILKAHLDLGRKGFMDKLSKFKTVTETVVNLDVTRYTPAN